MISSPESPSPRSPQDDPAPGPVPERAGERDTLAAWITPAGSSAWEQPGEPDRSPASDELADWLQDAAPAASSLEDWLQGPREAYAEREAQDAWSTANSVTGAWEPREDSGPVRSLAPPTGPVTRSVPERTAASAPAGGTGLDRDAPADAARHGAPHPRPAFRRELHGLRALALGLVAVYHVWFGRVSGGVDVFLFLSAFFLTGTFVRRLESGRPLSVPRYWLHTFKRLLPPAAVTILLTLAATAALLPSSLWPTVMLEAVASAGYVQNWLLMVFEVDYHARDAGDASPLQHFWSLSVQGQVFLLWPLLLALAIPLARRGRGVRRPLLLLVLLIGVASLIWSILSTQAQQEVAYFDTLARLWEVAAGSLLALALPAIDRLTGARRPESGAAPRAGAARALLGWAGVAALLACGIVLDVGALFPGWIAIWPLAAAAAVVVAGHSGRRWGVDALLSTRPAAFVGDISYALYLVHWPILVIWLHRSDQERAGALDGLVVLAAAVLLAWVLTRAVDAPVRRSRWLEARPGRALLAVVTGLAVVVAASGGWWLTLTRTAPEEPPVARVPASDQGGDPADGGAVATARIDDLRPYGWQLPGQWPDLPEACGGPWEPATGHAHVTCQQLLPADAAADGTIVVVGSSHARQFIPALLPYATANDLQVVNLSMDGCSFLTGVDTGPYCAGYDQYALDYVDAVAPEMVLTTVTLTSVDGTETMPEGTTAAVRALLDRGIDVLGVRDTPRWAQDQYQCAEAVVEEGGSPADADAACGADYLDKHAPQNPAAPLAGATGPGSALELVDAGDTICPAGRCAPILEETYVYLDDDHLTRRFVERELPAVLGPAAGRLAAA